MLRIALKGVLARKARLVLTALAVVLGTAFLTGTTVFGAVSATGHVVGSSSGTWTRVGRGATFTVSSLSGTVAYNATVGSRTLAGTLDLNTAGLASYYGLSGAAKYTCGTAGTLTLTLGKQTLKFQQ